MEMKRMFSLAIVFTLLAVSFAIAESRYTIVADNAGAQPVQAWNNTTTLTVNAKFPKVYSVDFQNATFDSKLDQQVDVLQLYYFTFVYNYSFGWNQTDFVIRAWYDNNQTGDLSSYPAVGMMHRNRAFHLYCNTTNDPVLNPWTVSVIFPVGDPNEVGTPGTALVTNIDNADPDPLNWLPEQRIRVSIPVILGPQLRAADGNGFSNGGPAAGDIWRKITALNDRQSWDFSVTVRDSSATTATNVSYGEFGIKRYVSLSVSGNPTGNAPPGGSVTMVERSNISYSSNTMYYLNVSIPDVFLDNNPANFPNVIPAINVFVNNTHPNATASNSNISVSTAFPGASVPHIVWGNYSTPQAMQPVPHGNITAGPLASDHSAALAGATDYTELEWYVDVPGGIFEGIYWTYIYVTIDADF